ncbi:MAG: UDP-N-acetylmuramoyl-L-alanine--D-glutamate ligase [Streptococcaceae bacterium]|jgi:UDP-N-acetylmuramoylalanine--D-glutamate ligase|nr:UDP-N-acetylmuramoyl-L-alanine--D-glutamate ligase [Streptococcaceae bacterium]
MKQISKFQNQKILVLGLARSGVSAAKLLDALGAIVTVNDFKPFNENPEAQELLDEGIRVITGGHPVDLLEEDFAFMVKNPGILYANPMVEKALEKNIPIYTEVELAYLVSEAEIIGITGTNGKTTTTTMIGELLTADRAEGKAYLSGNIGYPASDIAQIVTSKDQLVMELSSFQLMGIDRFTPKVAVITNFYEAHIDYHGSREEYVAAKWRIQENMGPSETLIVNGDQEELVEFGATTSANLVLFSTTRKTNGAYALDELIYYGEEPIMKVSELGVVGKHNLENALAAITVAKLYKVESGTIRETLHRFSGVEHRLQYIGQVEGRKFYNDSKATNILATERALSGFDNEKLILLAGGLDRGNSFEELVPAMTGLKALVLFGETKNKLMQAGLAAGIPTIIFAEDVEEAAEIAYNMSESGDSILLSPANASWDKYKNFEIRGEKFVEAVKKISEDEGK